MTLVIRGDRVKCVNCGTVYDKPPAEKTFYIGVPFRIEGFTVCPKCGSNAAEVISEGFNSTVTTMEGGF